MPPPYFWPLGPYKMGTGGSFASDGPGNANAAIYIPVYFPETCTLTAVNWILTNGGNNYDLGLYNSSYVRVASKGSTATSAGIHTLSGLGVAITAGDLYYVGIVTDNIGVRFIGWTLTSTALVAQSGCTEQAAALPLPATATPAVVSSWPHIPYISMQCS